MIDMKEKLTFSKIEILFMIVMVALVIIAGITVFSITTRNQNIKNLKEDAESLISAAKNAHASFVMSGKTDNIYLNSDGVTKGMCITIKGLDENGFLTREYENWEGYIVIEEGANKKFNYSIWATNEKYVIDSNKTMAIIKIKAFSSEEISIIKNILLPAIWKGLFSSASAEVSALNSAARRSLQ